MNTPAESADQQTDKPLALSATLTIRLHRFARARCDGCGTRRVRYAIALNGDALTGLLCAPCAGMR